MARKFTDQERVRWLGDPGDDWSTMPEWEDRRGLRCPCCDAFNTWEEHSGGARDSHNSTLFGCVCGAVWEARYRNIDYIIHSEGE